MEQGLTIQREVLGERNSFTLEAATYVVRYLIRLNRRKEAYDLVAHFLAQASLQDPSNDILKSFEQQYCQSPFARDSGSLPRAVNVRQRKNADSRNWSPDRDRERPEAEDEDEEREDGDDAAGAAEGVQGVGFRVGNAEHHA